MNANTFAMNNFIARAKTLGAVMTRNGNMKVTISGTQASQRPGCINIPEGDFTDPRWLKMVQGYIDHELGHEAHSSDEPYLQFARKGELARNLLNLLDDIFMEREVGRKFVGAKQNLETLARLAMEDGLFKKPDENDHPITTIGAYFLYGGRCSVVGQHCLEGYALLAKQILQANHGSLLKKLEPIHAEMQYLSSTEDCGVLVDKILDVLKNLKQDPPPSQKPKSQPSDANADQGQPSDANADQGQPSDANADQGQPSDANAEHGQTSDANAQQGQPSDASADQGQPSDASADQGQPSDANAEQGQPSDANAQQGKPSDASADQGQPSDANAQQGQPSDASAEQGQLSEEAIQQIKDALDGKNIPSMQDFHEALADLITEKASEVQNDPVKAPLVQSTPMHMAPSKERPAIKPSCLSEPLARQMSGRVYQVMHKALFDQTQTLQVNRKTGNRLNNRRLSGIASGNLNVFMRRTETIDVKAAVSVVIDGSGSMEENMKMTQANNCAFALALGLTKAGVASEFVYFGPGRNHSAFVAKSFDESPKAVNFKVDADGGTPTGDAMQVALSSLVLRPENKKLMFVLTDGEARNEALVEEMVRLAKSFGVNVIPIGIMTNYVAGFSRDEFVVLNDISQLSAAIRDALRLKLF